MDISFLVFSTFLIGLTCGMMLKNDSKHLQPNCHNHVKVYTKEKTQPLKRNIQRQNLNDRVTKLVYGKKIYTL